MKHTDTLFKKFAGLPDKMPVRLSRKKMRNSTMGVGIALLFLLNIGKTFSQVVNTESFDGVTFVPTGWTNLITSGSAVMWTRETVGANPTQAPHSGSGEARFYSYNLSATDAAALITPPFSLQNNTSGAAVSFWMYRDATYAGNVDYLDVYYNSAPNLTGATLLGTVNRHITLAPTVAAIGWYQYFYSIPNTVTGSSVYLILKATSGYGNNIFLDDVSWTSYPPACSGTPNTPVSSVATPSGCPNVFNITTTGNTIAPGITYQWQASSTSGGTYTNIVGGTGNSLTNAQGTGVAFYRMVTTCANGGATSTSSPVSFTVVNPGPCICNAYGPSFPESVGDEDIFGITFQTFTTTNNCLSPVAPGPGSILQRYSNYAGFVTGGTVCAGAAVPFTVNIGSCSGNFYPPMSMAIFLDINQNGSFGDPGETIYSNGGGIIANNNTGIFNVPATALAGTTRIRFSMGETSTPPPSSGSFGAFTYGEVEDYCITVLPSPTIGVSASTGSVCPGATFVTTGNGATTYSVNGGAGLTSGSSISLTPIANTIYTINGTGTNGCKSAAVDNKTVSVTALVSPTLVPVSTSTAICVGQTATLTVTGANTVTWTSPSSNATLITVNPVATTVYTVSGTGTTVCNGIKTLTLTVNPLPTITVNSGSICAGKVFTLVPGGANTYVYQGGSNTVSPSSTSNFTVAGTNTVTGCVSGAPVTTATVTVVPLPIVTVSSGSICTGDSYVMVPTGTNAAFYTFLASAPNPVSPTITSTYSMVGTATTGCVSLPVVSTVVVNSLPTVTAVFSPTPMVVCLNSVLSLTASGATTYVWNANSNTTGSTFTNIPTTSGSYFVVGTDGNGCTAAAAVPYTVNPLPNVLIATTNTFLCVGKSATLTPSGAPTFSWSVGTATLENIVSPIVTTVYNVTGTDANGCSKTTSVSVTVNTLVMTLSTNTAICSGNPANLVAGGANSYQWSNGLPPFATVSDSPTVTTTYTVTGTDAKNCQHTAMVTITVNANPTVTASISNASICVGESATLTAGGSATSYSWSNTSTGTSVVVSPTSNQTILYTVTGTDANNCTNTGTVNLVIGKCVGLAEVQNALAGLNVYPNPNSGEFTVELSNGLNKTIVITDLTGRIVFATESKLDSTSVNINALSNGVYYVKIQSDKAVEVIKVIKN